METHKCVVCGKPAIGYEPRFLYWYCKEHENTPPAYIEKEKIKYWSKKNAK